MNYFGVSRFGLWGCLELRDSELRVWGAGSRVIGFGDLGFGV